MKCNFRHLELKAKNLLSAYPSGNHLSSLLDNYEDINSAKKFQPSDKRIDTKNSIKCHEIMAKTYDPEKQLDVYIVLDTSGSGECGDKSDVSLLAALYLLFLTEFSGDRISLLTFSDKAQEMSITNDYGRVQDAIAGVVFSGKSNVESALAALSNCLTENSLVFIISDFYFELTEKAKRAIRFISANNKIYSLIMNENQNNYGTCVCFDGETGCYVNANLSKTKYAAWQDKIHTDLLRLNCTPISIDVISQNPLLPLVRKLL